METAHAVVDNQRTDVENGADLHTPCDSTASRDREDKLGSSMFATPVYRQRYERVAEVLRQENAKQVVDFGIAECRMLQWYKRLPAVEKVVGVDIDRNVLETHRFLTKPLTTDYLAPRDRPLWVALFEGSVTEYDSHLADFGAVVMIELIEHLEPDVLAKLPHTVFGQINPQLVIATTPNSDFNVLFPDFTGMRHWDHKFEWSQEQFQEWCEGICQAYHYTATYEGVGQGPDGTQHLGCCSQMALFRRIAPGTQRNPDGEHHPYSLVHECHHPHKQPTSTAQQILHEAVYYMQLIAHQRRLDREQFEPPEEELPEGWDEEEENGETEISLQELLKCHRLRKICSGVEQLRDALKEAGHSLSEDSLRVIYHHGLGNQATDSCPSSDSEDREAGDEQSPCDKDLDSQAWEKSYEWPVTEEEDWDTELSAVEVAGSQPIDTSAVETQTAAPDDGCQEAESACYSDASSRVIFSTHSYAQTSEKGPAQSVTEGTEAVPTELPQSEVVKSNSGTNFNRTLSKNIYGATDHDAVAFDCPNVPETVPIAGTDASNELTPPGDCAGVAWTPPCGATTSKFGESLNTGKDCDSCSVLSGQFSDADEDAI